MIDILSYVSLLETIFFLGLFVYIIYRIHLIPGIIAENRNHPQKEAIHILAWCGLILFPLWLLALTWAYKKPMKLKTSIDTEDIDQILQEIKKSNLTLNSNEDK